MEKFKKSSLVSIGLIVAYTVLFLFAPYNLFVFLIAMAVVSALIFVQPEIGIFVAIVSTMLFERFFTLQPLILSSELTYKIYPLDIVMLVTLAASFTTTVFRGQKRKFRIDSLGWSILLFTLVAAGYFVYSIVTASGDLELAFSAFKNYSFYALFFYLIYFLSQTEKEYEYFVSSFFVGAVGIIAFILIGLARGQGLWTQFTPLSTEGVRTLAFPHAFYLTMTMLLILTLSAIRKEKMKRYVYVGMWIFLAGVVGSLMRHLWLALAASTGLLFLLVPNKGKTRLLQFFAKNGAGVAIIVSFIFVLALLFPFSDFSLRVNDIAGPFLARVNSLARATVDESGRWRIYAWSAARESIQQNPIFGIGYGKDLTIDFGSYRQIIPIRDLHNSFLVLIVQMGLLGFTFFAAIHFFVLKKFYDYWKMIRKKASLRAIDAYTIGFFVIYVHIMTASMFQPYFETNLTGMFFWIALGMLAAGVQLASNKK